MFLSFCLSVFSTSAGGGEGGWVEGWVAGICLGFQSYNQLGFLVLLSSV